jgi:putative GTP pyrophosphokinase
MNSKAEQATKWYAQNRPVYGLLAKKVESIAKELLECYDVNYYSITSRPKTLESYKRKAMKDEYKDPQNEILDMAGIRIITYTDSDARKALQIIKDSFDIQPQHTVDKTEELGIDRVGYRSIHCIGGLGPTRLALPENKVFEEKFFEIQIRTILQHAWAEFEHDRNYKFSGVLPDKFKRRLSVVAGTLELIDREFDNLSDEIGDYINEVKEKTESGDLSIDIDSKSLLTYIEKKFEPLLILGVDMIPPEQGIISELKILGIDTLEKLDKAIPIDFVESYEENLIKHKERIRRTSTIGVLRTAMLTYNASKLLKYWKKERILETIPQSEIDLVEQYNKNIVKLIKENEFVTF